MWYYYKNTTFEHFFKIFNINSQDLETHFIKNNLKPHLHIFLLGKSNTAKKMLCILHKNGFVSLPMLRAVLGSKKLI